MKFCQLFVQIGNIIICRFFTGATHASVMCKECPAVELRWWGGADGNQSGATLLYFCWMCVVCV